MNKRNRFNRLSRRHLLKALGLTAGVSPLLPLLNASGQESTRPKRLLLIYTPDGAPARDYNTTVDWRPQGSTTDFTFHRIHEPLTPHRSKVVVPWGLRLTAGGAGEQHAYGMAGLWTASTLNGPSDGVNFDGGNGNRTGWGSGPSIDQLIARASGTNCPYALPPDAPTQETPFRTVELGVRCQNPTSLNRMIYSAANSPLHPEENPRSAFGRLFDGVSSGDQMPSIDAEAERRLQEKGALVDYLKGDLARLKAKVGREDYEKIDAHLEGLLQIEQRLTSAPTGDAAVNCQLPEVAGTGTTFPQEIRHMIDIAVGAFSCDVTRVMSLQLSYAFSHVLHSWLGHQDDHHNMSHDGQDRREQLQQIDSWYADHVAYLLGRLDSVSEGDSTLLDNTLIVWGRELGSTAHRMDRVPFILAGGGRGALTTGRFHNFDGQEHARLLVSTMQMMGLETDSIGNRVQNSGGLSL